MEENQKGDTMNSELKGRPGRPRELGEDRVQIAFYIDKSTHEDLKEVAGLTPVSAFIRNLIVDRIKEVRGE